MTRACNCLAAALTALALLGGCGSDADEEGTGGSPPEVDTQRPEGGGQIGPDDQAQPQQEESPQPQDGGY